MTTQGSWRCFSFVLFLRMISPCVTLWVYVVHFLLTWRASSQKSQGTCFPLIQDGDYKCKNVSSPNESLSCVCICFLSSWIYNPRHYENWWSWNSWKGKAKGLRIIRLMFKSDQHLLDLDSRSRSRIGKFLLSDQLPLTQTGVISLAKEMNANLQRKEEDKNHNISKTINLRQIKRTYLYVNST